MHVIRPFEDGTVDGVGHSEARSQRQRAQVVKRFREDEHRENELRAGRADPVTAQAALASALLIGQQDSAISHLVRLHEVGIGRASGLGVLDDGEVFRQGFADTIHI